MIGFRLSWSKASELRIVLLIEVNSNFTLLILQQTSFDLFRFVESSYFSFLIGFTLSQRALNVVHAVMKSSVHAFPFQKFQALFLYFYVFHAVPNHKCFHFRYTGNSYMLAQTRSNCLLKIKSYRVSALRRVSDFSRQLWRSNDITLNLSAYMQ